MARPFMWENLTTDETKIEIKRGLDELTDEAAFEIVREIVKEKDWNPELFDVEV